MKNIDVLCVGVTSYDFYFMIDHHPQPDEKAVAETFLSCGGGPAANAAITVAKMGLSVAFAGYLGKDVWGDLHLQELQQAGVQTNWIVRAENPTPISTVLVKPNGHRSLVNYRVANSALETERINFSNIKPKVILFDGHEPHLSVDLLKRAQAEDIKTILDAGSVNPGTSLLYDKVDFLICSEKFAEEMTNMDNMENALEELSQFNKNVVITLGNKGLIWKTDKGEGKLKAFSVMAVDTTGAGDIFHGVFAGCLALGKDWNDTLNHSNAAAALCCTQVGGRTSIPTLEKVENFIKYTK